jgi:hypothetical protein
MLSPLGKEKHNLLGLRSREPSMSRITRWLAEIPWSVLIVACLTLGLAPFAPPHVWEKITMLIRGDQLAAIDWFDLFFHGSPWIVLLLKLVLGKTDSVSGR